MTSTIPDPTDNPVVVIDETPGQPSVGAAYYPARPAGYRGQHRADSACMTLDHPHTTGGAR